MTSRPARPRRLIGLVATLLVLATVTWLSLSLGVRETAPNLVWEGLFSPDPSDAGHLVVREIRVPRTIMGLLVGSALGLAGALMQGITRNPLADPGILGVNAGASLLVVFAITLFGVSEPGGYIWFAFGGAALAALLVYGIGAFRGGDASPAGLALAGMAVTAAVTSVTTLILITDVETLSTYRFWVVGSLVGRDLDTAAMLLPFFVVGAMMAVLAGRTLNLLALGEAIAGGLGQNPTIARIVCGSAVVLLCGAATALAGPIAFVGLVAPHLARHFTGPDYRWLLAWSAVLGPVILLIADIAGRLVVRPAEMEAGLVVALLGAPILIAVARRSRLGAL